MDTAQHLRILQLTYAAQLADAVVQYGRAGVLESVTEERRAARLAAGAAQAGQLGIAEPAGCFTVSAELFGCADWSVEDAPGGGGFTASASRCMLCALVKKAGGPSPCRLFCLDPIEGMVKGLDPSVAFDVRETLFDGERCSVQVTAG